MSLLVWNCRGLGNPCTGKELGDLVRAKDPSVVFIAETWADKARLKVLKNTLLFDEMFVVPRINRGGGLVLFWKNSIKVSVKTSSRNHIDSIIGEGSVGAWRFTGFYGEPVTHIRHESWELLQSLNRSFNLPWLVAGDFNEIISNSEKKGGNNRSYAQMQRFREALDACSFMDLGYLGSPFTWQRHFRDGHSVWERLDRALANAGWVLMFGGSKIHHLQCTTSDHSPLWIMPDGIEPPRSTKPFRFEEIWLADKGCSDTVLTEWCREDMDIPGFDVTHKIDRCGKALTFWSRRCFGNVRKDLLNKRKLLARAKFDALFSGVNFRVRELRMEVNDLLDKETRLWLQRSRALWAVHDDKNSKFFHSKATQRHRKNKIEGIKNSAGHWCSRPKDIADFLVDYFKTLFSSSSSYQPAEALSTIQNVVTMDMNSQLNAEFKEWEIKLALN